MAVGILIRPTIPDNEGRTAFATLRRLGVTIAGLERAVLLVFDGTLDPEVVAAEVRADESIFNANTHALSALHVEKPAPGEVWIASDIPDVVTIDGIGEARRLTAWTLRGSTGPADADAVQLALERLLCNPAVQHIVEQL